MHTTSHVLNRHNLQGEESPSGAANHNKYCHFCQVRASSMLACCNAECSRRFCEHCLLTHLYLPAYVQHVKVRASSMLACSNAECSRRFCEHCLLTHLSEDVDPSCSDAWVHVAGVAGKQFKLYEGVMKALTRR